MSGPATAATSGQPPDLGRHGAELPTVLHVISGLGAGGAEAMLSKLVSGAARSRHIVVSLRDSGPVGARIQRAGVPVTALGLAGPFAAFAGVVRLARLVGTLRPQIVQGWMNHGNLAATLGILFSRSPAVLLWSVRQSLVDMRCEKFLTRRIIALNARLSRRPRMILYNSAAGAAQHEAAGFSSEKRRIVPNGFDLAAFRPSLERRRHVRGSLGVAEDEVLVGLIARFHRMKNHGAFFEAASRILRDQPGLRLLLAGEGMAPDNPELLRLIPDPLRPRTLLLGQREDIADLTMALDIACNVSIHGEGFANAIGEAMACGVPTVVTDVGDSARIVGDGGLVCADTGAASIAAEIGRLVRGGPGLRAEMGGKARARAEAEFALASVVEQYERIYDELLGPGERAPGAVGTGMTEQ